MMLFSDLAFSQRLERAEGHACAMFAEARRRLFPASGAEWIDVDGTYAVFDGVESPVTQTFGLGVFAEATAERVDRIEAFFTERGAPTQHEISPMAGASPLQLLCDRGYRPVEVCNVLCRPVGLPVADSAVAATARVIRAEEAGLWTEINTRGWCDEHPELLEFMQTIGAISVQREGTYCFLGEVEGVPASVGGLSVQQGVALFAGSTTVREFRRRGLQAALLRERLRLAESLGCDIAMMVADAGSNSQRNAERQGFRVMYTRTKWRRDPADAE